MRLQVIAEPRLSSVDLVLLTIFFLGIYLGVSIPITETVPFPAAPSGAAGLVLLYRRRDSIVPLHLAALLGIIVLYIAASLSVDNLDYLGKRFTGLVQLSYSLVIGYAMFLTLLQASRGQLSGLFIGFTLVILVGSLLESYAGLDAASDAVRRAIYESGIYDADRRDEILYGRVRPKLFTSEPSAVTFGYTLFAFAWFVISQRRGKIFIYLALLGAGLLAMPGPTLLLSLLLVVPYYFFVLPATPPIGQFGSSYRLAIVVVGGAILLIFAVLGSTVYAERFSQISAGNDPSFFYRVIGPALVAFEVMRIHPWAGAGLTGEMSIADLVINVFVQSPHFSAGWRITRIADVLTNYFWLHWIYLGLVWGGIVLAALSMWLRTLGVPSVLFCWATWLIFGQASGAYVSPKTWVVLLLAAALSVVHQRVAAPVAGWQPVGPPPAPLRRLRGLQV